jgi:hypothetical protein
MSERAILIPNSEHPIEMTPNPARVTIHEAVLVLKQPGKKASHGSHLERASLDARNAKPPREAVLRIRLVVGANATSQVIGLEELPARAITSSARSHEVAHQRLTGNYTCQTDGKSCIPAHRSRENVPSSIIA